VIIAAHNEESVIEKRIENLLRLDYPKNKLEVIIASDGSTDNTNELVSKCNDERLILLVFEEQRGRAMVHNDSIKRAMGEIVVFSDADTMFAPDFLRKIVRNFSDPSIGCVSGELKYINQNATTLTRDTSFYWQYELKLRQYESKIGILPFATGACMALRKELFKPLQPDDDVDFICPLDIILQGHRVIHESEAVAFEVLPSSAKGVIQARTRMTLRNIKGTLRKMRAFNPLRYPQIWWAVVSHKILRWLTPYFLLMIFLANLLLLNHPFYRLALAAQWIFYGSALLGYVAERKNLRIPIIASIFSFCVANIGLFLGVLRAALGEKMVTYETRE
jgi:cellulose synthase/poly-beta-1,6-N-acetylglucosamine synthase-like glycosyltransferase